MQSKHLRSGGYVFDGSVPFHFQLQAVDRIRAANDKRFGAAQIRSQRIDGENVSRRGTRSMHRLNWFQPWREPGRLWAFRPLFDLAEAKVRIGHFDGLLE